MTVKSPEVRVAAPNSHFPRILRIYRRSSAFIAVSVGTCSLYGWAFHQEWAKSVLPGINPIKANTALGLGLSGVSLWLLLPATRAVWVRRSAQFLALLTSFIGAATLLEYVCRVDLGIDQFLFKDAPDTLASPGRMSIAAALGFCLIGMALLSIEWRTRRDCRPSQLLSLVTAIHALISIIGYLYHSTTFYKPAASIQISLATAVTLFLLSIAVFFARPETGLAADISGMGPGSSLARRLLPAVILVPLFLGWLHLRAEISGATSSEFGVALLSCANIFIFVALVWVSSRKMNGEYDRLRTAQVEIGRLNYSLEARVAERTSTLEQQAAVLAEHAALLDLAQDAIIVSDWQNRISFWSRGAEAMYGWSRAEAEGRGIEELLRPAFTEPYAKMEAILLREGKWKGEAVHHTRDGIQIVIDTRWVLQRDERGNPYRILMVNTDITERKKVESNLLLLTERFSLATAVANVGVWDWDLPNNHLVWDATMLEIYGCSVPAGSLGEPHPYEMWSNAVHPLDLPAAESELKRIMHDMETGTLEFRIVLPDQRIRTIAAALRVLSDEQGKATRVIGVNVDVTERRNAEAAMQHAKEAAEAANRAKSDFLANMSHEIRTPMNGIIGMTDLALETELTVDQRELLTTVKSSADSLLVLLNDILDFSKIEAGKLDFESIDFCLSNILNDVMSILALRAKQKDLDFDCEVPSGTPDNLVGDPSRLRQILLNLAGNAIKFTARGTVGIQVELQHAGEVDVLLHFRVKDTGIGIPPEKQLSVFEEFTQVDTSTTRKFGGSGLGLAISSRLVSLMGGTIWVESIPGIGTTFHFTLPLQLQKIQPTKFEPLRPEQLENIPVLIVEDCATDAHIVEAMCLTWKMKPKLVENGRESLQFLKNSPQPHSPFRLVLINARMPETDGFELAKQINSDPSLRGSPMIMLTAAPCRGDGALCREYNVNAYLTKPVRHNELLEAVLMVLGSPVSPGETPKVITRHTLRENQQPLKILLAEDNPVNRSLAIRLLNKRGHHVLIAENGNEAVAQWQAHAPDVILMDIQMPELDGLEATKKIRQMEACSGLHVPIIAMTAHAMVGDKEMCLASGMDEYVSKPLRVDELFIVIEETVNVQRRRLEQVETI